MSEKERLQLENELLMTCSKAQAINKYIDELEESSKLSELWCKSQQENQQLKKQNFKLQARADKYECRINKAVEYIEKHKQKYDVDGSIEDFDELDVLTSPRYLLYLLKGDKE